MRKYVWLIATALVAVIALTLAGCAKDKGTDELAALGKRLDSLEQKVGNVDGTPFNGKDVSILGTTPKFAITMREYGDRYADMYFAAKGGNWALAAYLDHYLRNALSWTKVTKPKDQGSIDAFSKTYLDPLLVTIGNKDWKAFQAQYGKTLEGCNGCHKAMGYGFIQLLPPKAPADNHWDYSKQTAPTDFKEFVMPK